MHRNVVREAHDSHQPQTGPTGIEREGHSLYS